MNPTIFDRQDVILLLCALGLLACFGYLLRPVAVKYGLSIRSRRFAHFAEPLLLLLVIPVLVGWPLIAPIGSGRLIEDPLFSILGQQRGLWLVTLLFVTLACVLATRL